MKKQHGFTLIELLICIAFIVAIGVGGSLVYAAWHFIAKFW